MIRALAGLVGAVLIGAPLLTAPVVLVALIAAVAAVVITAGVAFWRPSLCSAGAALAIGEYAVALALAGDSPDALTAIALGVALLLFLMVVEFGAQLRGVAADRRAVARQIRHWVGWLAATALVSAALASASRVTIAMPAWAYIAAAGLGTLAAFAALVRLAIAIAAPGDTTP